MILVNRHTNFTRKFFTQKMQKVLQKIIKFFCSLFSSKKKREVKQALIMVQAATTQIEATSLALSTAAALAAVREEIRQTAKQFDDQLKSATQRLHAEKVQITELPMSVNPKCVVTYLLLKLGRVKEMINQLANVVEVGKREYLKALQIVTATEKVLTEEDGQPKELARWNSLRLTLAAALKTWGKANDAVQEASKTASTEKIIQTFQHTSDKMDEIANTISDVTALTLVSLYEESDELFQAAAKWVQATKTITVILHNLSEKIREIDTLRDNEQ
jgi:hypothetical protein